MNEYAANVMAASMMAQSLGCCIERKFLDSLNANDSLIKIFNKTIQEKYESISWLKITQIGNPINNSMTTCFSYIQKILMSCALPNTRLTFLVIGDGVMCHIYLGLRGVGGQDNNIMRTTVSNLNQFVKACWPGMQTNQVSGQDELLKTYFGTKYNSIYAVTGIPTLPDRNETAITTIEQFINGQNGHEFAYLVVADPINSGSIDDMLSQCREMSGQLASVKSVNISQSVQKGWSQAHTIAESQYESWSHSEGISQKDYKKAAGAAALGAGLALSAGFLFPPALAILPGIEGILTGAVASSAPLATFLGLSGVSGMSMLSGFIPQKTENDSHTSGNSHTESDTTSFSNSITEGLSRTLVNKHVEAAVNQLDAYCKRLELAKAIGAWKVGCYIFSSQYSQTSAWQLKSLLSGSESSLEPIRIHDVTSLLNSRGTAKSQELMIKFNNVEKNIFQSDDYFHHPLGDDFSGLKSVLTTRELSAMVNFPLHSVPGISVVDSAPEFSLTPQKIKNDCKVIRFGNLLYGGAKTDISVYLPLDNLSRHALVCGVNGSGKTNTVLSVLDGFTNANRPYFVIEPAKTEYVDWAIEQNEKIKDPKKKIKIFIPGCEKYAKRQFTPDKLRMNPFEVIDLDGNEPHVLSHIDRLKAIFAAAFPMQDVLPVIMEHLLTHLYRDRHNLLNPNDKDIPYNIKDYPTLDSIDDDFINNMMTGIGYSNEVSKNIKGALFTRIESLKFGWKGELLNNKHLTGVTWKELFDTPCVLNLSYVGDDQDRAFIMSLILQFLYEYRIAESEKEGYSFNDNICRHLVVVEEAHRVMSRCDMPLLPQYKSAMMFSNFLSEIRAYGQGMMIVDQIPTRLIEDAIKNTNIKIVHKLVASDDASHIAECIGLTTEQQRVIAKLSVGQAILAGLNSADVGSSNSADIYLAQINKMK